MPDVILVLAAVAALIASRRFARTWVRDRWLDDRLSNRQAAILFWVVAAAPLLLIALIALISDASGALILVALLVFVLLPMTTLMVIAIDFLPTRDLKERLRRP